MSELTVNNTELSEKELVAGMPSDTATDPELPNQIPLPEEE